MSKNNHIDASDETLLEEVARGDRSALSALLGRYGPGVRQTIATELGSKFRAVLDQDDVMQVTYLEAFLRMRDLKARGDREFVAWLSQIARNNMRDAIKGLTRIKRPDPRRQVQPTSPDEQADALIELAGGDSNTPSRVAGAGERKTILTAALNKLPPDYAGVLREYDLDSRSIDEIASRMGRSKGAVFMLRARALERLKEILPTISAMYGASRA